MLNWIYCKSWTYIRLPMSGLGKAEISPRHVQRDVSIVQVEDKHNNDAAYEVNEVPLHRLARWKYSTTTPSSSIRLQMWSTNEKHVIFWTPPMRKTVCSRRLNPDTVNEELSKKKFCYPGQILCGSYCANLEHLADCLTNPKCDDEPGSSKFLLEPAFCPSLKRKLCDLPNTLPCRGYGECVFSHWFQNGRKDCFDGSDEDSDYVRIFQLARNHLQHIVPQIISSGGSAQIFAFPPNSTNETESFGRENQKQGLESVGMASANLGQHSGAGQIGQNEILSEKNGIFDQKISHTRPIPIPIPQTGGPQASFFTTPNPRDYFQKIDETEKEKFQHHGNFPARPPGIILPPILFVTTTISPPTKPFDPFEAFGITRPSEVDVYQVQPTLYPGQKLPQNRPTTLYPGQILRPGEGYHAATPPSISTLWPIYGTFETTQEYNGRLDEFGDVIASQTLKPSFPFFPKAPPTNLQPPTGPNHPVQQPQQPIYRPPTTFRPFQPSPETWIVFNTKADQFEGLTGVTTELPASAPAEPSNLPTEQPACCRPVTLYPGQPTPRGYGEPTLYPGQVRPSIYPGQFETAKPTLYPGQGRPFGPGLIVPDLSHNLRPALPSPTLFPGQRVTVFPGEPLGQERPIFPGQGQPSTQNVFPAQPTLFPALGQPMQPPQPTLWPNQQVFPGPFPPRPTPFPTLLPPPQPNILPQATTKTYPVVLPGGFVLWPDGIQRPATAPATTTATTTAIPYDEFGIPRAETPLGTTISGPIEVSLGIQHPHRTTTPIPTTIFEELTSTTAAPRLRPLQPVNGFPQQGLWPVVFPKPAVHPDEGNKWPPILVPPTYMPIVSTYPPETEGNEWPTVRPIYPHEIGENVKPEGNLRANDTLLGSAEVANVTVGYEATHGGTATDEYGHVIPIIVAEVGRHISHEKPKTQTTAAKPTVTVTHPNLASKLPEVSTVSPQQPFSATTFGETVAASEIWSTFRGSTGEITGEYTGNTYTGEAMNTYTGSTVSPEYTGTVYTGKASAGTEGLEFTATTVLPSVNTHGTGQTGHIDRIIGGSQEYLSSTIHPEGYTGSTEPAIGHTGSTNEFTATGKENELETSSSFFSASPYPEATIEHGQNNLASYTFAPFNPTKWLPIVPAALLAETLGSKKYAEFGCTDRINHISKDTIRTTDCECPPGQMKTVHEVCVRAPVATFTVNVKSVCYKEFAGNSEDAAEIALMKLANGVAENACIRDRKNKELVVNAMCDGCTVKSLRKLLEARQKDIPDVEMEINEALGHQNQCANDLLNDCDEGECHVIDLRYACLCPNGTVDVNNDGRKCTRTGCTRFLGVCVVVWAIILLLMFCLLPCIIALLCYRCGCSQCDPLVEYYKKTIGHRVADVEAAPATARTNSPILQEHNEGRPHKPEPISTVVIPVPTKLTGNDFDQSKPGFYDDYLPEDELSETASRGLVSIVSTEESDLGIPDQGLQTTTVEVHNEVDAEETVRRRDSAESRAGTPTLWEKYQILGEQFARDEEYPQNSESSSLDSLFARYQERELQKFIEKNPHLLIPVEGPERPQPVTTLPGQVPFNTTSSSVVQQGIPTLNPIPPTPAASGSEDESGKGAVSDNAVEKRDVSEASRALTAEHSDAGISTPASDVSTPMNIEEAIAFAEAITRESKQNHADSEDETSSSSSIAPSDKSDELFHLPQVEGDFDIGNLVDDVIQGVQRETTPGSQRADSAPRPILKMPIPKNDQSAPERTVPTSTISATNAAANSRRTRSKPPPEPRPAPKPAKAAKPPIPAAAKRGVAGPSRVAAVRKEQTLQRRTVVQKSTVERGRAKVMTKTVKKKSKKLDSDDDILPSASGSLPPSTRSRHSLKSPVSRKSSLPSQVKRSETSTKLPKITAGDFMIGDIDLDLPGPHVIPASLDDIKSGRVSRELSRNSLRDTEDARVDGKRRDNGDVSSGDGVSSSNRKNFPPLDLKGVQKPAESDRVKFGSSLLPRVYRVGEDGSYRALRGSRRSRTFESSVRPSLAPRVSRIHSKTFDADLMNGPKSSRIGPKSTNYGSKSTNYGPKSSFHSHSSIPSGARRSLLASRAPQSSRVAKKPVVFARESSYDLDIPRRSGYGLKSRYLANQPVNFNVTLRRRSPRSGGTSSRLQPCHSHRLPRVNVAASTCAVAERVQPLAEGANAELEEKVHEHCLTDRKPWDSSPLREGELQKIPLDWNLTSSESLLHSLERRRSKSYSEIALSRKSLPNIWSDEEFAPKNGKNPRFTDVKDCPLTKMGVPVGRERRHHSLIDAKFSRPVETAQRIHRLPPIENVEERRKWMEKVKKSLNSKEFLNYD
ncbi:unnamed protein product [Bursaphelenchus xylophilus]|nr:unnamed protein product [Bursaphelenchus xylophilus]CAG9111463.1 unnamed protein product [Bursaphelenchus xylophilus]